MQMVQYRHPCQDLSSGDWRTSAFVAPEPRGLQGNRTHGPGINAITREFFKVAIIPLPLRNPQDPVAHGRVSHLLLLVTVNNVYSCVQ